LTSHATFPRDRLFLIAGPCVIESDEILFRVADHLAKLAPKVPGGIIFKASFDKANRSNAGAFRGPGIEEGLRALERVRERTGLPVLTDVHLPEQCAMVAQAVDVLQIPAFLCRQTDLLEAAGATGAAVNVKKGQWMHPEGMAGAVRKVRAAYPPALVRTEGACEVAVTERGTFMGYGDLVVDMRAFSRMREACDAPVIFDATHSVQQPGKGDGGASGGLREHIPALLKAACAAGIDGMFIETHPTPDTAPSDGPNMLPLHDLDALVTKCVAIWELARS
jgi:2-dehydro-3-deoxyphosphooctonate aldolase (KDO 8-P synthase)